MSRLAQKSLFNSSEYRPSVDSDTALYFFQNILSRGRDKLAEYHLEKGNAALLGSKHSWLIDQILILSWSHFFPYPYTDNHTPTLIATGGYGRCEMNLYSDIDLLILFPKQSNKNKLALVEKFIRFCWDIGLKVGHSTLALNQCIRLANKELTVMTNFMESRLLIGSQALLDEQQQLLRKDNIWPIEEYFKQKLVEQIQRHLRFRDTAYNLEPNIKESPGGLRDLHMISWIANRKFGTGDLSAQVECGLLTPEENKTLLKGRTFLWNLRNGLHLLSKRCEDRLLFDYQRELAKQLGYKKDRHHLAVEKMMKVYYRTVKELQLLNELILQNFQENVIQTRKPSKQKLNSDFNIVRDYLEVANSKVFKNKPNTILSLFYLLQQHPNIKGVRANTVRLLRKHLYLVNSHFRKDPANLNTFIAIFKHQTGLTHTLRRMNAYGVLGAFFPEFGKIVGQMQHDLFHVFTVDAHSLFVVGNIRGLAIKRNQDEFPILRETLGKIDHRERLYLAALCHDIGKGSGRDHSIVGEKITRSLCRRLRLSKYDTEFTAWLVRNHLIMSWTAQKEDIQDPRVVDRFAKLVGSQDRLDNLYLLTIADIRGTSHKIWNNWKGQLLQDLYSATSRRLRSPISGYDAIEQPITDRKKAIVKILEKQIPKKTLHDIFNQFHQDYFMRNSPNTSAWQILEIVKSNPFQVPLVSIRYKTEVSAEQILIVAPESNHLLSKSTAVIDSLNLDILDARIHITKSNLNILVFITTGRSNIACNEKLLLDHKKQIRVALLTTSPQPTVAMRRPVPHANKQFTVPTKIYFDEDVSLGYTIMEVIAQDRPGLLHLVSEALITCKVHLISAKISTVGEKAEDTFLIRDRNGDLYISQQQKTQLELIIKNALN